MTSKIVHLSLEVTSDTEPTDDDLVHSLIVSTPARVPLIDGKRFLTAYKIYVGKVTGKVVSE